MNDLKELVKEIRRVITVVTKFPKWEIKINGVTKLGNKYEYEASFPFKK